MNRFLLRMPNWLGDFVMAIPLILELRAAFPKSSITALCPKGFGALLAEEPALDEIFSVASEDVQPAARRKKGYALSQKIEARDFDVGILTTRSLSAAWLFWQGKVKRRIGYRGGWPQPFFLTDRLAPPKEKRHQVEVYKGLLQGLGVLDTGTAPRIVLNAEERLEAVHFLEQKGVAASTPCIGLHPGAAYGSAKCWPAERFRALAKRLLEEEPEAALLFFGDSASEPLLQKIVDGLGTRAISLAGQTPLRRLACLLERCTSFVTNDSGPMHVAAAVGAPAVALFGSTDPERTAPYKSSSSQILYKKAECSPCFKRTCPIDFRCMRSISVEEVLLQVRARVCR